MYFDSLLDNDSRSWLSLDDDKKNKPLPDLPQMLTHAPAPSNLSLARTAGSRSRSASQSSGRERLAASKDNSAYSTPPYALREGNDKSTRVRANSDLQSSPKPIRRPQDSSQAARPEFQSRENQTHIFKEVENIISAAFKGCDCLNESFSTYPHPRSARSASSGNPPKMKREPTAIPEPAHDATVFEPDAKTLLLGDLSENSAWWMNEWAEAEGQNPAYSKEKNAPKSRMVSSRSPRINWTEVAQWYHSILSAGNSWTEQWKAKKPDPTRTEADSKRARRWASIDPSLIGREISESRLHLQRVLLKATESLLKRPRRVLKKPEDTRFLFILLANPLLSSPASYSQNPTTAPSQRDARRPSHPKNHPKSAGRDGQPSHKESSIPPSRPESSNHHYGLIKRILGLMSNLPNGCHHCFVSWAARFSIRHFERLVELVGGFLTYRLSRQHGRKRPEKSQNGNGDDLIPSFASASGNTPAELHAAISRRSPHKKSAKETEAPIIYDEDWQIRAAARVLSLFFAANISGSTRKSDGTPRSLELPKNPGPRQGHMIPISAFYNTLLDYSDLVADFEIWESRVSKFSFCQYPFLLSIWAKIHIMEHDARRQMEVKARDAFFNSVLNHRAVSQYLVLKVRRECLVEDSLKGVSEVVGTGQEEIKKGLRIEFLGEEGIDAGGLRKEWFLLLVREVFDPNHGERLSVLELSDWLMQYRPLCLR
jgi:E3 ubiquitin-protein ligase HECTD2